LPLEGDTREHFCTGYMTVAFVGLIWAVSFGVFVYGIMVTKERTEEGRKRRLVKGK
jgi:hypothetical protein